MFWMGRKIRQSEESTKAGDFCRFCRVESFCLRCHNSEVSSNQEELSALKNMTAAKNHNPCKKYRKFVNC